MPLATVQALLAGFPHWVRCAGRFMPTVKENPPDSSIKRHRGWTFDATAAYLGTPFAWLVVAQPAIPEKLCEERDLLALRIPRMRNADNSEDDRLSLTRAQARYRELLEASATGLWNVTVVVGGQSLTGARRAAASLAAAAPLSDLPYVLVPDIEDVRLSGAMGDAKAGSFAEDVHCFPIPASGALLAALARPPGRELPGLELQSRSSFDINAPASVPGDIELGRVLDENLHDAGAFRISRRTLNRHALVAGSTGGGKSQTVRALLEALARADPPVPWLVIEPAKAEYASTWGRLPAGTELIVIRPGDLDAPPAGLNPLEPERGFPLQTHIDLIRALFAAAFEAEEPFPQVLAKAMTACYQLAGWNLRTGQPVGAIREPAGLIAPSIRYPTLSDLQAAATQVVEQIGYGAEVTANIRGFVDVRIGSLRTGTPGAFFEGGHPLDVSALMSGNAVLELEDIANDADKAFLIGTVLIRVTEYLRVHRASAGGDLTHLTVIEEAHRLLRNTQQGAAAAAVELFASLLAEIRAYGEGVLVAEQIPSKIVPDVIKNSALKVLHRLPSGDDREVVGATMNLQPGQSEAVVSLLPGDAAVTVDGMDRPVLVRMPWGEDRESSAGSSRMPPLAGRRSPLCGPDCQSRACTLAEIDSAESLGGAMLLVWLESVIVSFLALQIAPGPSAPLVEQLRESPGRAIDCAVMAAVERSVAARRGALRPLVDAQFLAGNAAATARTLLFGGILPELSKQQMLQMTAGPYRYIDVLGELLTWQDSHDGIAGMPVSSEWNQRGLFVPANSIADQLAAVRDHPLNTPRHAAAVFGDAAASGLLAAVNDLSSGVSASCLESAFRSSCSETDIRMDRLAAILTSHWNHDD